MRRVHFSVESHPPPVRMARSAPRGFIRHILLALLCASAIGLAPGPAAGQGNTRLDLLFIGPLRTGRRPCDQAPYAVRARYERTIERRLTAFRLLPEKRLKEAAAGREPTFDEYAAGNFRLAREVGRRAGADFVFMLDYGVAEVLASPSGFGCRYTIRLIDAGNPHKDPYEESAYFHLFMGHEEASAAGGQMFRSLFVEQAGADIRQALARKAASAAAQAGTSPEALAREKERAGRERAEAGRLRRERELAEAQIEKLRREQERMEAERKRLAEQRRAEEARLKEQQERLEAERRRMAQEREQLAKKAQEEKREERQEREKEAGAALELEKGIQAQLGQLARQLEDLRRAREEAEKKRRAELQRGRPAAIFLRSPRPNERVETETVRLEAAVTSEAGIQKVEVLLNGEPASAPGGRAIGIEPAGRRREIELSRVVQARLGENELKVVVTTEAGARSERAVRFTRERPVGNIHAVVIGVDAYKRVPRLRYAVRDARAFADYLTGHLGVPKGNVTLLLDEAVTLRSLLTELGVALRRAAGPKDTVLIYYAGHGATEPDSANPDGDGLEKYLLPHDADPDALFGTALSMAALQSVFGRIRSDRLIFLADACYSGAVGGRTILTARRATVSENFMNRLSRGKGRIILSAAGANEVAKEDERLGHGVFTYHLIEALKGKADKDGDGYVTVDEAFAYLASVVPRATGQTQTPVRKGETVGQVYLGRAQAAR